MKNIITVFLIFLTITVSGFAHDSEDHLSGRDVVNNGNIESISGFLFIEDDEWAINSNNTIFLVHMGPSGYELELEEGEFVKIYGFVLDNEIAPITMQYKNTIIPFWSEDGIPSWSGNGDRQNAVENGEECSD